MKNKHAVSFAPSQFVKRTGRSDIRERYERKAMFGSSGRYGIAGPCRPATVQEAPRHHATLLSAGYVRKGTWPYLQSRCSGRPAVSGTSFTGSQPMLKANPTTFHRRLLAGYFSRRMRKRFAGVLARGLARLEPWNAGGAGEPLLIVANHSSWWDAALPIVISCGALRHDAYGIMEEAQLARYRFFTRAGIFSIDRDNPRRALESLRYAAALLGRTGRVLWMFPQGRIVPNDRRPIECEHGIGRLIGMIGECTVVPVAFRYEVGREELPLAYISVGEGKRFAGDGTPRELSAAVASMLTTELDSLRDTLLAESLEEFLPLLAGRTSISTRWDGVRGIFDLRF